MKKLIPDDLLNIDEFELLAEVEHKNVKQFILEQISFEVNLIRFYSVYQITMLALFVFLLVKAGVLANRGMNDALIQVGLAVSFSFTILIILHEFLHAIAYWITGAKNLKVGAFWQKFVFYVVADRQVIGARAFQLVAYTPFVVVKLVCLFLGLWFWSTPFAYFCFSLMAVHSLFCAGDMAMLAFYQIHADKEIYNVDDVLSGKTFFYYRKQC